MKKYRQVAAVVTTAAMVSMPLVSCGFGTGGSDKGSSSATTLNLMVANYSSATKAGWEQIVKDFETKNNDVKVKLEVVAWVDIDEVVTTRVQAGTQPDLLNINSFVNFASDGLLYKAKDVVSPDRLNDFEKSFADAASMDGVQYGLPLAASVRALFYNKDLLSKAGVTNPPKTWDELTVAAKKVKATRAIGYGMPLGQFEAQGEAAMWFYGGGGGYGDEKTLTIDTPLNVAAAKQMQKMVTEGLTQANPGATDRDPLTNVFIQGKIAMIESLPPTIGQIKDKNPSLKYGIAPSPTKDGSALTLGVEDYLLAFKNKTDKTAAINKFLNYFYAPEVYTKWANPEGFLPVTKSGAKAMTSNEALKPFLELLPGAKFYPSTNLKWATAKGVLQNQLGRIAQGDDPAVVLREIEAKVLK